MITHRSRFFPSDVQLTSRVDAALRRHVSELRDYTQRFHERWKRWGITTIPGPGWAVRPFFVPASTLEFVSASLHFRLLRLRQYLRQVLREEGAISRLFHLPMGIERGLDLQGGIESHDWLSHWRPDGFLFEDGYVLSELNFGNGIAVSCGYTELVADYWRGHPVLKRLGIDVERFHRRPLPRYLGVIRRAMRPSRRPFVALLAHRHEWEVILSYPKRVEHQFDLVQRELFRMGVESRIVTEEELVVGRDGNPRVVGDPRRPDLIMLVTIGSSFLDEPGLMRRGGRLSHLRGCRIGEVNIVKPLAATLMDKGALPLLGALECSLGLRRQGAFCFELAPTHFPRGHDPSRYSRNRTKWVFKRAFDGKDTHVGISCSSDDWRRIVKLASQADGYVAQRYVSMPRARIPVFIDQRHLEFVESRVELSTFIFDGAFGGAAARHAPNAEGLVMSDAPQGYGFSTVFAV